MCSAKDLARYVLEERGRLTGFQLQKLLYYCKAWGLAVCGEAVFNEPIKAWKDGPVVQDVFREHAGKYGVVASDVHGDRDNVPVDMMPVVDAVLCSYAGLSGDELRDLTHSEKPWVDAYNGITGNGSNIISDESMTESYRELLDSDADTRNKHRVPHFPVIPVIYVGSDEFAWLESLS